MRPRTSTISSSGPYWLFGLPAESEFYPLCRSDISLISDELSAKAIVTIGLGAGVFLPSPRTKANTSVKNYGPLYRGRFFCRGFFFIGDLTRP